MENKKSLKASDGLYNTNISIYYKIMKDKDKEIVDDAIDGMLLLKCDKEIVDNEIYAILSSIYWEYPVPSLRFTIQDEEIILTFYYEPKNKNWIVIIVNGIVKIGGGYYSKRTMVIEDGTSVEMRSISFTFFNCIKSKKPGKSYHRLIAEALASAEEYKMTLSEIYDYFEMNHGFIAKESATWKNSIRHNLSLNKIFTRVPKRGNERPGKGMFWTISEEYRDDYLQSLEHLIKEETYLTQTDIYLNEKLQKTDYGLYLTPSILYKYSVTSNMNIEETKIIDKENLSINETKEIYRIPIERSEKRKMKQDTKNNRKRSKKMITLENEFKDVYLEGIDGNINMLPVVSNNTQLFANKYPQIQAINSESFPKGVNQRRKSVIITDNNCSELEEYLSKTKKNYEGGSKSEDEFYIHEKKE
ncbi:Fork head like protein 2 [Astathelohania contejeani]|uniref:Fork head like protein 2 n=1 Tax=Astathelohania contejeani TaxID=164912 RepID=A0ABQ7I0D1_9MICR|nr:Fork head like protein 2 [Thelohania contejeani]